MTDMDTGDVKQAARQARDSDAVIMAARVGYAVNGVLHLLIGWIALQLAWGLGLAGSGSADQSGALSALAANGLGRVILWIGVVGWLGLALWQLTQAIASRGEASDRLKSLAKGAVYLALSWTAFTFAKGDSSSSKQQSTDFTASLMSKPFGTSKLTWSTDR